MKDAKNVQWISVFEYVLKLLRWSEPNAFGYCGVFGLSEAIRKRQEKTIALPIRSVDCSTQPTRTCPQTKIRRNRVLKKKLGFKLHKETFAFAIRSINFPWKKGEYSGERFQLVLCFQFSPRRCYSLCQWIDSQKAGASIRHIGAGHGKIIQPDGKPSIKCQLNRTHRH